MTDPIKPRETANAIGQVHCLKSGKPFAFLYQWNNGELQLGPMNSNGRLISESESEELVDLIGSLPKTDHSSD